MYNRLQNINKLINNIYAEKGKTMFDIFDLGSSELIASLRQYVL